MTIKQQRASRAGYWLSGAIGIVRLVGATTFGDLVLAGCLTAAELSAVRIVEQKARGITLRNDEIAEHNAKALQLQGLVDAATEELERREDLVRRAHSDVCEIEEDLIADQQVSDAKALALIAVNAARAGYLAGIAENDADLGAVAVPA